MITVTEPFICPSLYEKYVNSSNITVVDEWTLSQAMGANLATEMEEHYQTFVVSYPFFLNRDLVTHICVLDRTRLC